MGSQQVGHDQATKHRTTWGLPKWLSGQESGCNAGDVGSILGREAPLEKEMATHSSVLACETPWTEEPTELQSTGVTEESDMAERLNNNKRLSGSGLP